MLVRKLWTKYTIKIAVYFVGHLYYVYYGLYYMIIIFCSVGISNKPCARTSCRTSSLNPVAYTSLRSHKQIQWFFFFFPYSTASKRTYALRSGPTCQEARPTHLPPGHACKNSNVSLFSFLLHHVSYFFLHTVVLRWVYRLHVRVSVYTCVATCLALLAVEENPESIFLFSY